MPDADALHTEHAVLAAMILDRHAIAEVESVLDPGDYLDPRHEVIHRALVALVAAEQPTDVPSLADRLERDALLRQAGGEAYLWTIAGAAYTSSAAEHHADLVHRQAVKRRIREAGEHLIALATSEGDAYVAADQAATALAEVAGSRRSTVPAVGDDLAAVVDSLSHAPRYAPTPWTAINRLIGGWRPGALYVVGARPGSGKTIMGLQAAAALSATGPVAFSSLEMDRSDLIMRLLAMRGGVRMTNLTDRNLTEHQWRQVADASKQVSPMPLFIDHRAAVNVSHVRAFARGTAHRHGGHLAGVVVDYLQLLRPTDPKRPRWEAVGEMSGALKALARELECPVIALAQLNRGTEGVKRAPSLGDLRESGSIEQDADVVLLLQREQPDDPTMAGARDTLTVAVAKNRHGNTGLTELDWQGFYARVVDLPADAPGR